MSDFAIVDMQKLESDILDLHCVQPTNRFPSTEQIVNRGRLSKFLELTKQYIDSEGLLKMQKERDELMHQLIEKDAEIARLREGR